MSSSPSPPSSVASSTSYATTAAAYAHSLHSTLRRAHSLPPATAVKKFPTITLTAEEQAHYDRVVGRLLYRAVQEYGNIDGKTPDSSTWAPVRKKRNLAIYRNVNGTGDPRVSLMIGVGTIDGSLEDVMDGVYCDTTQDLRALKVLLNAQFLAGAILQVSEKRTPDDPFSFAGIKWHAAKTPGGAVSYDRDLVNYERQGMTFDADGNEIAYHLLQSVDRPEWPANVFKNLIRAHTSLCCLYKRTADPSKVECFLWGEFFGSGRFPQRLSDYGIAGKWLSVVNAAACSKAKKLSQLKQQLKNKSSSSDMNECHVCHERRSMFNAQQPCGACQQNVCKACSKDEKLFELDRAGRAVSDRFCSKCLDVVAKQRGSKITWDGVEVEQPPAYFDYAFQFMLTSKSVQNQSKWLESDSSVSTLWSTDDSVNDTRYLDESLDAREFSDDGMSDISELYEDEDISRRRRTHASRLSSSSSTYATKEEFLADLFAAE